MTKLFQHLTTEIDYSRCGSAMEAGSAIFWALSAKRMTGIRGLKTIAKEFGFATLEDILSNPPAFVDRSNTLGILHRVIRFDYECDGKHRTTEFSARYHFYAADIIFAFMKVYAEDALRKILLKKSLN